MVLKGIDLEVLAWYFPDDVCKESNHSVLTIGLLVKIVDDDIGKVHGFKDAPKKILDIDLEPDGTKGPPWKYYSGEVVNIDGVARVGADVIGTDGPTEDVGSGMVTWPNVYPFESTGFWTGIGSTKVEGGDWEKYLYK